MKFRDVALTVLIVLAVVILIFLLSSRNPKEGVVAPLVVPVRTFFGYLGGRRGGNTNIKINVKGGGGAASKPRYQVRDPRTHLHAVSDGR